MQWQQGKQLLSCLLVAGLFAGAAFTGCHQNQKSKAVSDIQMSFVTETEVATELVREEKSLSDCIQILSDENGIQVCFDIQQEKVMAIGEEMNAIQEEAYMNGENWDIFLQYYLAEHAPEVLVGMETDPEAGMYVAYYDSKPESEAKAKKLAAVITSLVEHPEEIYRMLQEAGDEIEWD